MLKYEIQQDRVSSVVELSFNDKSGRLIEERKVFLNPVQAEVYVKRKLTDYMQIKLRMYVYHAYKLGMASQSARYSREDRTNAMSFLLAYVRDIRNQNCFNIAFFIRQNVQSLEMVLPVINNASYGSSKRTLDELVRLSNNLK